MVKNLTIIVLISTAFFFFNSHVVAFSVSGGGLKIEIDSNGAVTQIWNESILLPASETVGGISICDYMDANIPTGQIAYTNSFEGSISNWIPYESNGEISFTITNIAAFSGNNSLLCIVTNDLDTQQARFISPLIHLSTGTRFRIQCKYKATRGYLSSEFSNHSCRNMYQKENQASGNSLGFLWCDSNGTPISGHLVIAPFVAQADSWKSVGREIDVIAGGSYLRITVNAQLNPYYDNEGFFVDDIEIFESPVSQKMLAGSAWETAEGICVTGSVDNLEIDAVWRSVSNAIETAGTVYASDGLTHPFDLIVSLPVKAENWQWLYDSEISFSITNAQIYSHNTSADYQSYQPVSLYPYGGISSGEFSVAIATPLVPPTLSELRYNGKNKRIEACFHLGVSELLSHTSATFAVRMACPDSNQKFRGIIKWYHDMYVESNEWFETQFDMSPYLSGENGNFSGNKAELCAGHDTQSIMSVQYTVPDLVINNVCYTNETPPTLSGLWSIVENNKTTGTEMSQYYFTHVSPQIMRDSNGDPVLKYLAKKDWTGPKVQGCLKINPAPGKLEHGYHSYITNYIVGPAFQDTLSISSVLDAVQLDNFFSKTSINCSTSQIVRSSHSLTYTPNDYTVGLPPAAGLSDYLSWLRNWIDAEVPPPYRAILINWWGLANANACLPWIDICGAEVDNAIVDGKFGKGYRSNFDPVILRYKLALAYHKPKSMAFNTGSVISNDVIDTFHTCLLYGMGGHFKIQADYSVDISYTNCMEISREFSVISKKLNSAGWEPITLAESTCSNLFIERYGKLTSDFFFFVVHNSQTNTVNGTVVLNQETGITDANPIFEHLSQTNVAPEISGETWFLSVSNLPPHRALVFQVFQPIPEGAFLSFLILYIYFLLSNRTGNK